MPGYQSPYTGAQIAAFCLTACGLMALAAQLTQWLGV